MILPSHKGVDRVASFEELVRDSATGLACGSGDEDSWFRCHLSSLIYICKYLSKKKS